MCYPVFEKQTLTSHFVNLVLFEVGMSALHNPQVLFTIANGIAGNHM